jgi:hypothetical protein
LELDNDCAEGKKVQKWQSPSIFPLRWEEMEETIAKINSEIFYSESTSFGMPLFWNPDKIWRDEVLFTGS